MMKKTMNSFLGEDFIAEALNEARKCPNCQSDYKFRYDKFADNHRPLLLRCGHTICENCVLAKNTLCLHCSKLVNLPAGKSTKKYYRDNFDLNFFMVGEMYNYTIFHGKMHSNLDNDTQPNRNDNNNNNDASRCDAARQLCCECTDNFAVGSCASCKADYCQRCFHRVHSQGKVLQAHKLQKFHMDNKLPQVTPRPIFCRQHKRNTDSYCQQCKVTCCNICIKQNHETHRWHRLASDNKIVHDDILSVIEMIKTSRHYLRTAQQEVSAAQTQFEEGASKTYLAVAKYFLELHSFLQNQQTKIKEDYIKQSQSTLAKLNEATSQLEKKQTELKHMRSLLERYAENAPYHINVREVLSEYMTKLHNMECQVKVSKIVQNPFVFEGIDSFKDEIKRSLFHSFVDPNLEIRFFSTPQEIVEYVDQSMMTLPPSPSMTDSSEGGVSSNLAKFMPNKSNKKQKKKKNMMIIDHEESQNFSDKFEPNVSICANNDIVARISHLKDPQHFFIQQEKNLAELNELSKNFEAIEGFKHNKPPNIVINRLYIIYSDVDMKWHRVIVKRILERDMYEVFLVDIGRTLQVDKKTFRELESSAVQIPHAAIRCAFYDLMPIGDRWSDEAISFLMDITKNQHLNFKIIERDIGPLLKVDILAGTKNETYSVREAFLYTGLGRAMKPPSKMKVAPLSMQIQKQILITTEVLNVKMRHCENPQEFYVIKTNHIELKWVMREEMSHYYKSNAKKLRPFYWAALSTACAVQVKEDWHRGCIEEIMKKGIIRVRLVDEGTMEMVHWHQIYPLKPEYAQPREYAIKCRLADIEPLQENNYEWTHEAKLEFKMLTSNPTLQMIICASLPGEHVVELTVNKPEFSANVGALLVKNRHGISTGKHTLKSEIYKYYKDLNLNVKSSGPSKSLSATDGETGSSEVDGEPGKKYKLLKRTSIKISYAISPGHFYVQLLDLLPNINKFLKALQEAHEHLREKRAEGVKEWLEDDNCLVTDITNSWTADNGVANFTLKETHFYRGIISSCNYENNPSAPYSVFLRDYGMTIKNVSDLELHTIGSEWVNIASAVVRCHMACIGPTAGNKNWSVSSTDYFHHTTQSFPQLSATMHFKREKGSASIPIILWGTVSEPIDPLAPCIARHSCINRIMVKAGLAHCTEKFDMTKQIDEIIENEWADGEISISQWFKNFQLKTGCKMIDEVSQVEAAMEVDNVNDTNYAATNLHWNIEMEASDISVLPTSMTFATTNWSNRKIIEKTIFVAHVTYVDSDCVIYLHDSDDHGLLAKISDHISKSFAKYLETPHTTTYKVGQACIAQYHLDKKYYRGIICSYNGHTMEYSVEFIDYGNVETVTSENIRPFAPFPELPALASKYKLEGIAPRNHEKKFTRNVLDIIHSTIVGEVVNCRVVHNDLAGPIKSCSIRLGPIDVVQHLHEIGVVSRAGHSNFTNQITDKQVSRDVRHAKNLKDVDYCVDKIEEKEDDNYYTALFENLEKNELDMAAWEPKQPLQPQTTRKRMFETKEYELMHEQMNLDSIQMHMLGARDVSSHEFNVEDADDVDVIELGHSFSESFMVDDVGELNDNMAIQNSINSTNFCPKDTSTVTSYSGTECFKRSHLPQGLTSFECHVVRIISPTILQILPELPDFKQREIELQKLIDIAVKTAEPVKRMELRTVCLARYTKDNKYYRAVIRSKNEVIDCADVLYVDYLNTETVPIEHLLECPDNLLRLPLRTFRVRLHGIVPNAELKDRSVCRRLATILGQETVFARVRHRPCAADCAAGDLLQVTLHDNNVIEEPIYQQLLDNKTYLRHK